MSRFLRRTPRRVFLIGIAVFLTAAIAAVALQGSSLRGMSPANDLGLAESQVPAVNTSGLLVRTLLALGLLVAVIYLGAYGIRRLAGRAGSAAPSAQLRVLGSTFLGPKRSVCAVLALDRVLIVGVTDVHITLLTEIDDPEKVAAFTAASAKGGGGRPFASYLDALLKGQQINAS